MKHKSSFRLTIFLLILLSCIPASTVKAGPSIPEPNVYQNQKLDSGTEMQIDGTMKKEVPEELKGLDFSKNSIPPKNAVLKDIFHSPNSNSESFGKVAADLKLFSNQPGNYTDKQAQGSTRSLLPAVFGGLIVISILLLFVILVSRLRVRK
ncbi:type VII secretion EssA family protein [Metabacillus sp. RGM 3146]|uniref:type VII secretion EssA family protein n=1 Tax=Metabacillus sp. RGM 3146 TaxID=3401092 RepID=UPI003B9A1731